MAESSNNYIILTPMRNERATVEKTIDSMVGQTVKPMLWIILDDGSTDGSPELVNRYTADFSWIKLIRLADRGFDLVGKGVAEVLNHGLDLIKDLSCDYVAKLDADLELPSDYFETLIKFMETHKTMGICSGHPFTYEKGKRIWERHSDYFPSGTARLYRRRGLEEIGPFVNSVGWDTVDILRMRMHGYGTCILHDLAFHHMRRMGTRAGYIDGMIRDGRNAYLTGYSTLFFIMRALFNMRYKPYLVRTVCMLWGFFGASLKKLPRTVTDKERDFHIQLQRRRLRLRNIDQ